MLNIRFLGPIEFEVDGSLITLQSRKAAGLLAYLALTAKPASRPFLAEMFWPDHTEKRGRANLSWVLNHLRKHLPGCLTADIQTIQFKPDETIETDFSTFQILTQQETLTALREAVTLSRGELLAGFNLDDCLEFELWLTAEREQWRQRVADTTLRLVQRYRESGSYVQAIDQARQLLALAPWRESAHQELIRLLALTGHRSEALAQFERCRQILRDELGIDPSEETERLITQIQAGELRASLPPTISRPYLPPKPTTPFFGRTAELAQIKKQLLSPNCRLLTIFGIGGMGKTRLAIEAGHQLGKHFPDGVLFVPLAPLDNPQQITAAIGNELAFRTKESDKESIESQLYQFLASKKILLLLDNFEHLAEGKSLVIEILKHCPDLKIIATSRTRLNLQAETIFQLGGLEDEPQSVENSAMSLFLERASRVQPNLQPTTAERQAIDQLISLVGSHPMAIELAAAQLNLATVETILAETAESINSLHAPFDDLPERHHSIEAIFQYSWHSLPPLAQGALGRLAYCQGGCTPEAARQITGVEKPIFNILENQALIRLENGRFQIHELLRQYVQERLNPEQLRAAAAIHAEYYLTWLVEQKAGIQGANQKHIVENVRVEIDNIRRSWRWLFSHPDNLTQKSYNILQICSILQSFFQRDGRFSEGIDFFKIASTQSSKWPNRQRLSAILDAYTITMTPRDWLREQIDEISNTIQKMVHLAGPKADLALFYFALGYRSQIEPEMGIENDKCCRHLQKSLSLYLAIGDQEQIAAVRFVLAQRLSLLGNNVTATEHLQQCLSSYSKSGDLWGEARTLQRLGIIRYSVGEFKDASHCLNRCRTLNQSLGFLPGVAFSTRWLGNVAYASGEYEQAHAQYLQALDLEQELGDSYQIGRCYNNLGAVCKNMREYEQAEHWYKQSVETFKKLEVMGLLAMVYNNIGMLYEAQTKYEEALSLVEKGLELRLADGGWQTAVDDMINMAQVLTNLKQYEKAQSYLKQALRLSLDSSRDSHTLDALQVNAQIYAETERPNRAMTLIELILTHPSANHFSKQRIRSLITIFNFDVQSATNNVSLTVAAKDELEYLENLGFDLPPLLANTAENKNPPTQNSPPK